MIKVFKNFKEKLAKTKNGFIGRIADAVKIRGKVDDELIDQIEEILIEADIGVDLSMSIVESLKEEIRLQHLEKSEEVLLTLKNIIKQIILKEYAPVETEIKPETSKPYVCLFVGVNGVGKTTSIGKLAAQFRKEGKSVLLVAGDTFRAAAIEQLSIWADRNDVPILKQQPGADPSAVVFDGIKSAITKDIDIVLIDTAGRLHNKTNLMNELNKIGRTVKKLIPEGPHQTYLIVDATTGQNAVTQARIFNETVKIDGIILTKLDGTAKGGIVISIKHELGIPVKYIGVGEQLEDLQPFDPEEFLEAIF